METRTAQANGIDIACRVFGSGPPLVLVHGLACGQRMWMHQTRALRSRFRVITFDQRGHGLSGAPTSADAYSLGHLTQDLVAVLDQLALERCHLVGFSLGGGPALAIAVAHPDRLASLTLIGVGSGTDDPVMLASTVRRWTRLGRAKGLPTLADEMLLSEFFKTYAQRGPRARRHMRGLVLATPLHGLLFTLSEVLGKRRSLSRMTDRLSAVRVPTAVVRGQADKVSRAGCRVLASSIPDARDCVVSGAGHMVPLECPDALNEILAEHCCDD